MSVVRNTSAVVQLGSNHTFSVLLRARGNVIYSWTNPQGGVVANTSTLTLTNIKMADAGTYTLVGHISITYYWNIAVSLSKYVQRNRPCCPFSDNIVFMFVRFATSHNSI